MDEKLKNDGKKIMLVQNVSESDGKLRAVTSMDEKGNIQTIDPVKKNMANMLNVNTQDSALEAFFKKLIQEAEDPSRSGLSVPAAKVFILTEKALEKLIKMKFDPEELEKYRVDPAAELQKLQQTPQKQEAAAETTLKQDNAGETTRKPDASGETAQTFQPYDTSKIDLNDLEKKGIRIEDLEPHLRAMSFQHKSPGLIEMSPEVAPGVRIPTKGRVSLEEQADGSLKVIPHYHREKLDLDAPLYGVQLPDDVKKNIQETRHAGRVLDLELTPGQKTPCFVSRDALTNTLEVMPVSEFSRQNMVKGKELSEGNMLDVYSGRKMLLEGFTTRAIREGMQNLRPGKEYDNLYLSAKARSEADWLVGINASQALAITAGRGVWSLGRVQTPTLAMICSRYLENKAFTPQTFFQLKLHTAKDATAFSALSTQKFGDKATADTALAAVTDAGTVEVTKVERKEINQQPPLLYDLTALQKEANSKHGFSADKTLSIAQALYEAKLITYPRTGSRYIPADMMDEMPELVSRRKTYNRFSAYAAEMDMKSLHTRSVDDSKITDHHAILPTENIPKELTADQRTIYENKPNPAPYIRRARF